ncbi:MAG TPA: hypothetical protein VLF71_03150 [Candidatus Saccharimonadales bacterium]|nr:hypothetical protein [Candidatus Saccharimonadales bacterium]
MDEDHLREFQHAVLGYYQAHGRHALPWRQPGAGGYDPYSILVSEIMLQQTQVQRVIPKYAEFLAAFPDCKALAAAPLGQVLQVWSGLGYNRRAKFLWQAAGQVVRQHGGEVPRTSAELVQLPGVGPNTAGAVLAYAYNMPAVFVETNIRTVFIHHFFAGQQGVPDRGILELVARTLPDNAREWYWALMDYGSHLKRARGNLNKLSKHYTVQPRFAGSKRQVRGQVLKLLAAGQQPFAELSRQVPDMRLPQVLADLIAEGLVEEARSRYKLPGA